MGWQLVAALAVIASCGRSGFDPAFDRQPVFAGYGFEEGEGQTTANAASPLLDGILGRTLVAESRDPLWSAGYRGTALTFDDANDVVTIAYLPDTFPKSLGLQSEITMTAWVLSSVSARFRVIFEIGGESNGATIGLLDTGQVRFILRNQSAAPTSITLDSSTVISQVAWHHIAATSGTDGISLYIYDADRRLIDSVIRSDTYFINTGSDGIAIGNNPAGNSSLRGLLNVGDEAFGGTIDEVRLYDVEISRAQIEADAHQE